jgi:WD40 repeat protein
MKTIPRELTPIRTALIAAAILLIAVPGTARSAGGAPPVATNDKVVFASDRTGDLEVYSMNADGSGQTQLTNSPGDDTHPVWSPNGSQIAFMSARTGSFNIFRMAAAGGVATPMTTGLGSDIQPTWAPDGGRIAFVSDRTGVHQVYTIAVDGRGLAQLTTSGRNVDPDWSPDGNSIVFTSNRGGNEDIYVMNADGSNVRQLTTDPARDYGPYWSPDGSKIVFQTERDGNSEIYVMSANGAGQTRLTNDPGVDSSPAWSPDGTKIAFHSDRDGDFEIYSMNVADSSQAQLTSNTALDKFPDWRAVPDADVDPPVLTLPGNLTVDATSPAGVAVSYAASATDVVDPLPLLNCSPPPGSTFPIGTTTVTCTATDNARNSSNGSFTVTVVGAQAQLIRLMQSVLATAALPQAVKAALLNAAANFNPSDARQRQATCGVLRGFIAAVQSFAGRTLPAAQAADWIADANRIRAVLGCT